jgi:hypothetical protein
MATSNNTTKRTTAQAKRVHSTPRKPAPKITAAKTQSAVSQIEKSGLELVPIRKNRGKLATMRDYAKIDFEPWTRRPGMKQGEMIPSHDVISNHGVTCRIAYGLMLLTRDEMIDMHSNLEHDMVDETMARLMDTGEFLKATAQMVETAYVRVLASASAARVRRRPFKGVNDKPARRKAVA